MIRKQYAYLIIIILGIIGGLIASITMKWGPWAGSDSVAYIEAARNLASGEGIIIKQASGDIIPLSLHPPLYSILLAVLIKFGLNIIAAAHAINVIFFALFITMAGLSIYELNHNIFLSSVLSFALISSSGVISCFTGAMSEAVFLFTFICSMSLLIASSRNANINLLIISAFIAGLSLLARYAGVTLIATAILAIPLFFGTGVYSKIKNAIAYILISVSPFILWTIYVRSMGIAPCNLNLLQSKVWERLAPVRIALVYKVWDWLGLGLLFPLARYQIRLITLAIITAVILCTLAIAFKNSQKQRENQPTRDSFHGAVTYILFSIIYLLFILFSFAFSTQLPKSPNERLLMPIFISTILATTLLFSQLLADRGWISKNTLGILLLLLSVKQIPITISFIETMQESGIGYTSKKWQGSELIKAVEILPKDTILISNEIEAIMLYTNRPAYRIPELYDHIYSNEFLPFGYKINDGVQRIFVTKDAALVLFNTSYQQFYKIYGEKTDARIESFTHGLTECSKHSDGSIYFYNPMPD